MGDEMATRSDATSAKVPVAPSLAGEIPLFEVGRGYMRQQDIHLKYGGSWQNGISSSAVCPAIFVFTGDTGEQYGYKDGFDSAGVFSYSGEGQVGDMVFKAGNRSLRDHAQDGRAVHLFHAQGKGKPCQYVGEFVVANHSIVRGPDKNGDERDVIVFHMLPVEDAQDKPEPADAASQPEDVSLAEARARALKACSGQQGPAGSAAVRTVYQRSQTVRAYVLKRAKGRCEGCAEPAPFLGVDGQPYLEAHHTTRLSDGGLDHPRFLIALCPTCHRRVHHGHDGKVVNQKLKDWLQVNEAQD
jgi:5-methylcytosine-specific restriction protein A